MPPRVQTAEQVGGGFNAWYESVPPVTRYLTTAMLIVTIAVNLNFLPPFWIAMIWPRVFKKLEVWRLATNFLLLGKLGFNFVVRLLWMVQYAGQIESQTFQFEPADYVMLLLVNGSLSLALGAFMGWKFLGMPLIMSLIYVWARYFPDGQVSLYGLVKIQSFYLPFAFAAISVLLGQDFYSDLAGIAIGHVYYFLKDIYPLQSGRDIIQTPNFLRQWLADAGLRGAAPPPREARGQPAGFHAFRGSGRRLGAD